MEFANFACAAGLSFKPLVEAIKASWTTLKLELENDGSLYVYKDEVGYGPGISMIHIELNADLASVHLNFDGSTETKDIIEQLRQQFASRMI